MSDKAKIVIRGAKELNLKVTRSTHSVVDEEGKVLYEVKK